MNAARPHRSCCILCSLYFLSSFGENTNMSVPSAPSLSTHGWITDTAPLFTYVLTQFYNCQKSQTSTYVDTITSLPEMVARLQADPVSLSDEIGRRLTRMMERYFTDVQIDCTYEKENPDTSETKVKYTLKINFTHNGKRHDAAKLLLQDGTVFSEFIDINNG